MKRKIWKPSTTYVLSHIEPYLISNLSLARREDFGSWYKDILKFDV